MRGDEGFPITNWSVNWSGIEKWWFMDKLFKSISLSHGFNGERSMSSQDENNDGHITDDELQNEQYSYNYSPIIGINTKSVGRSPITFKVNYNLNRTIKKIDESTERNHRNQVSSSVSYRKSGGLTIPVFFFDSFYIPNDVDFALNFNWDIDIKLMATSVVEDLTDFNEQTNNTSWSLKPNVTYSFTRWVNGNFYFVYGVSENKTTGKNEEKDFGFSVNIKIQG
jgi:cell surface protein SprA